MLHVLQWGGDRIQIALEDDCGPSLSQECRLSSRDVASSIVFGVLVLVYVLLYLMYLYRAFRWVAVAGWVAWGTQYMCSTARQYVAQWGPSAAVPDVV